MTLTIKMQPTECGSRTMGYLSLVFGLLATGTLLLAVSTDFWLHASEWTPFDQVDPTQVPNEGPPVFDADNMTFDRNGISRLPAEGNTGSDDDDEEEDEDLFDDSSDSPKTEFDSSKNFIEVKVHSGLWRTCVLQDDAEFEETIPSRSCFNIVYFGQDVDRTETTHAINRAIRKASPVIVGSLLVMVIALSLSILGSNQQDVRALFAAILYITSALSLALGVILYIAAVNDEVSHRRKSITGERDGFEYSYGWAFIFNGISFISSMVAAVNNISLYLLRPPANHGHYNNNAVVGVPGIAGRCGVKSSTSEIHALVEQNKSDSRRTDTGEEEEDDEEDRGGRRRLSMDCHMGKVKVCSSNSDLDKSPHLHNERLLSEHRIINITTPV